MLLIERKVSFDPGQRLVGGDDLGCVHLLGRHGGADDVDPVQGRFGGDLLLVTGEPEPVVGDVQDVVLGHLVPADDLADPDPDLPAPPRRPAATAATILASAVSVASSSARRLRARSVARAGLRHATRRSPVVGVGDLGQVHLVEQAHLQRAVISGQGRDGGGTQRGDPAETRPFP